MPTVDELVEKGPPSAPPQEENTRAPRPLGVPEFTRDASGADVPFTVERRRGPDQWRALLAGAPITQNVAPRYWTGDEWKPAGWNPADIEDLQILMARAGLFTADPQFGVWDPASRKAYEELLGRANAMGATWQEVLQSGVENPPEPEPLQVKLTDPTDLRAVFRAAAFEVSATQFTPGQIDAMVAAYHEKERAAQEALARGDETVMAPPDPGAFAEARAEQVNPEGVAEREMQNAEDAWLAAIGDTMGAGGA